jgi:hypothetical protein
MPQVTSEIRLNALDSQGVGVVRLTENSMFDFDAK